MMFMMKQRLGWRIDNSLGMLSSAYFVSSRSVGFAFAFVCKLMAEWLRLALNFDEGKSLRGYNDRYIFRFNYTLT